MIDALYAVGQTLCLLGLGWGAWLALGSSEMADALREAKGERRRRAGHSHRHADTEDPHVSSLGYWP